MKITKIHIDGFGKLHDYDVEPGDGITIFGGRNEAGKSTLHLFIRSILYGASTKHRLGAKSIYERMRPWTRPEIYRGRLEVEFEQQRYMIERNFNKSPDDLTVMELGEGTSRAVADPAEFMKQALCGLTETAYVNTVSAGQLGTATQKDMANELRKYAANVGSTMNPKLNADRALKYLEREKAALESKLDTDAPKEYNQVLTELKRIDEALKSPENENKISLVSAEADRLSRSSGELSERMNAAADEITGCGETLKQKGFADEAEIKGVGRSIHEEYNNLGDLQGRAFDEGKIIICALLYVTAAAAAGYGYFYAEAAYRTPAYIFAGVCTVLAVIVTVFIARLRRNWEQDSNVLSGRLEPYIGENKADEASLGQFDEYIGSAELISDRIKELESNRELIGEEQRKLNAEYSDCLDKLSEQHKRKAGVEELLSRAAELRNQGARLQRIIRNNKAVRENLEAIQLAEETLTELAQDIRNAAGTYINKAASEMISAISCGVYDSISAGQSYDIELNSKDGMVPVSDMSAGTADQVYLAIRLATIRFITGEDDSLPLILDDSFNLYDDERLSAALRFLADRYKGQVLIFTCQQREEDILTANDIAYKQVIMG